MSYIQPVYKGFEEFHVGDKYEGPEREILASDIEKFAQITGDFNAIHLDEEYARKTLFGHRIAHGLYIASLLNAACSPYFGNGSIYMNHKQYFMAPVYMGDKVTCGLEIKEKIEGKQLLVFRAYVKNQNDKIVLDGEITVKIIKPEK